MFGSYVLSKLKYGVASAWLSKSQLRKLDRFQANCLRKLLGDPPSFISRISNQRLRQIPAQEPLSKSIAASQIHLIDNVWENPAKQELRDAAFVKYAHIPITPAYARTVGRPRHNWAEQVMELKQGAVDR